VSIEVSPDLARDTDATIREAERIARAVKRPNLMVKIPATVEGLPAITAVIAKGINVNVTLIFALERYAQVIDAYLTGLERRLASGGRIDRIASVASFFVSRLDTAVDALLDERVGSVSGAARTHIEQLRGKAAIANAKLAYEHFQVAFESPRFAALRTAGARVQRPLWASTSTKNPAYPDVYYVEALIGTDTVNTLPPADPRRLQGSRRPRATHPPLDGARAAGDRTTGAATHRSRRHHGAPRARGRRGLRRVVGILARDRCRPTRRHSSG
jgi:transaldolase